MVALVVVPTCIQTTIANQSLRLLLTERRVVTVLLIPPTNRQMAFDDSLTSKMLLDKTRGRLAKFLGPGRPSNHGPDKRNRATESLSVRILGKAANGKVVSVAYRV